MARYYTEPCKKTTADIVGVYELAAIIFEDKITH